MEHPTAIRPREHAVYAPDRMGKSTLFRSERVLVGLNAFEPGHEHALHTHDGMDKVYHVIAGRGVFLLDGREVPMQAGRLLVAPAGEPHGIRNPGPERLLVLAVLAPGPR
jgi:mannose-6-phosphate isomerase-like protein (cupin superfamily)